MPRTSRRTPIASDVGDRNGPSRIASPPLLSYARNWLRGLLAREARARARDRARDPAAPPGSGRQAGPDVETLTAYRSKPGSIVDFTIGRSEGHQYGQLMIEASSGHLRVVSMDLGALVAGANRGGTNKPDH